MAYTKAGRRALPYPQKHASVDGAVEKPTHGGRRDGAGRKPKSDAMVTSAFVITQQQAAWLEAQTINTGDSKSEIVRAALNLLIKRTARI